MELPPRVLRVFLPPPAATKKKKKKREKVHL
jgi:hypothetical protein